MPSNTRYAPFHPTSTRMWRIGSRGLARLHAVAVAVVLCTGLAQHGDAQALALGRIVVQSALGEPLRAEIDIPAINADEASSLRVGLASGDAFRAAGMDFNPALTNLQISLQRRADGRAFLRLTSSRPVTEPFVDMIVEVHWASGRIVRDYTLLFDPPKLHAATPVAPLPAGVTAQPAPPADRPGTTAPQTPPQVLPGAAGARVQQPARPEPAPRGTDTGGQIRVKTGDTAGRIAALNRPANVSLDQMLVAMLRANPKAFIGGNVNRVKAGAVLDLPGAADAGAVTAGEARQIIAAQSRDFNEFRRRLAGTAPEASLGSADRQATGRVQAEVEDKKSVAPTQDKLTLSKGAAPAQTAAEEQIAQERQAREASTRVAELSRNIEELANLGTNTAAVAPSTTGTGTASDTAATAPALTVPAAPPVATATTNPTTAEATETASVATDTAVATPTPRPVTAPRPLPAPLPEEPSFMDQLSENPLVLPAAGGLLALLAGLGFFRLRQRKKKGHGVDSSFLESRLQADSFFGSSGGQRIDTAEASVSGSSMVYSPSQLDAAGDVDPVAEADVYLAYGRDLQAEEILKEAMRSTPARVAIHNKLLEIYAKRRDAKTFEVVAIEAYGLTQGQGSEWGHACELGRELDPSNPLYQPDGNPGPKAGAVAAAVGGAMNTRPVGGSTFEPHAGASAAAATLEPVLDLSPDEASSPAPLQASAPTAMPGPLMSGMDGLGSTEALTSRTDENAGPPSMPMDFDLDFLSEPAPLDPAAPASTPATMNRSAPDMASATSELLSFDLSDINLTLEDKAGETPAANDQVTEEGPLDTKLSLAAEFRAIGDLEGARSLAEEVLAEATGTLKTKASTFLADLS